MIKSWADSYLFRPPKHIPSLIRERPLEWINGNPVEIINSYAGYAGSPSLLIRILYCHGNGADIDTCRAEIEHVVSELSDELSSFNPMILCYIWDYPGYGLSGVPMKGMQQVHDQASMVYTSWNNDFIDTDQQINKEINIVWGFSIGTSVACHLSRFDKIDILFLQAPFADLLKEQGHTTVKWLIGDDRYLNNTKLLEYKHPKSRLFAQLGELDMVIPISAEIMFMLKDYEREVVSGGHDTFGTPEGASRTAQRLASLICDKLRRSPPLVAMEDEDNADELEI